MADKRGHNIRLEPTALKDVRLVTSRRAGREKPTFAGIPIGGERSTTEEC